ncbi:MAG TPA: ATP--guanido phosphotransferase, partial [Verrucomicrobiae bacterium]|nr:ATP--guanido phosphotransferase [Verrucomicrobiae bacterium]
MKTKKIIERTKSRWMEGGGNLGDVVISSRIRLARNLEGYPFPLALTESRADTVLEEVSKAIALAPDENYDFLNLREVPQLERYILVEKHLISPQHAENPVGKGVAIKEDQSVSIMVNEEDHLRIQCLLPGLALEDAWSSASKADDVLENTLDIAFS